MARAVKQHKAKPAKRTSRPKASRASGRGSRENSSNSQFDELLKDAFLRLCGPLGGSSEAVQRLTALACQWPLMPVMVRYANSKREEILPVEAEHEGAPKGLIQTEYNPFSNESMWGEEADAGTEGKFSRAPVDLSVGIDDTGADCLDIHDRRYFHPAESEYDGPAEFFVRSADVTRELERLSSTAKRPGKRAEAHYLAAWYRDEPQDLRATATPPSTAVAAPATKRRGSRQQRMIQQIAAEEFPGGYDQIETGVIIHKMANRLQRQRLAVPKRDTFLRALGRRKD